MELGSGGSIKSEILRLSSLSLIGKIFERIRDVRVSLGWSSLNEETLATVHLIYDFLGFGETTFARTPEPKCRRDTLYSRRMDGEATLSKAAKL